MNIIYIDSLFLLNLTIDYLILLAAGRITSLPLFRRRIFLAAAFGGAYAVVCALWPGSFLPLAVVKLLSAAVMVLIAYGFRQRPLRNICVFLILSAAFGGAVWACSFLGGSTAAGIAVPPPKTLLLAFSVCYAAVTLVFRRTGRKAERTLLSVLLSHNGASVRFSALQDTGNELCDPLSGSRVMVVDAAVIAPLFPAALRHSLQTLPPMELVELLALRGGCNTVRLIPYSTVGVSHSLLAAFRPDSLSVNGREERAVLVALAPGKLCTDEEFSAVF